LLAVEIVKSILLSRWIGGAGVIVGAISIIAGIEVAYVGFGYTNFVGLRDISMIIYFYMGRGYRCFYVEIGKRSFPQ
jgi:hypothetical protein